MKKKESALNKQIIIIIINEFLEKKSKFKRKVHKPLPTLSNDLF